MSGCIFESEGSVPSGWMEAADMFYYDGRKYHLDTGDKFIPMDQTSVTRHMRRWEIDKDDIPTALCKIQLEHFVSYVGPLAGRKRGIHTFNGRMMLASVSPAIIEAKVGPFPTILGFLRRLFADDDYSGDQVQYFIAWMAVAYRALLDGKRRPGQALVLAGPPLCGKTMLTKVLICPVMGGRQGSCLRYLSGRNNFNGDLIGCEVLMIDDEAGTVKAEHRRALGDNVKNSIYASQVRIEKKGCHPFEFDPLWRVLICVNDDPEALLVLPTLTRDLEDKFMFLKCSSALDLSDDEFEQWQADIAKELPMFCHHLVTMTIPDDLKEPRSGVKAFHHPEVIEAMGELSKEHQLLTIIRTAVQTGGINLPWEGTAAKLKATLVSHQPTSREIESLIGNWHQGMGVFLGRISQSDSGVVKLTKRQGDQYWRLTEKLSATHEDENETATN